MANSTYDVIVVGAGVEGSSTAFQLRRRGVKVLLLEQFPLPHSRGSSHGPTRITRKAYAEAFYTKMMEYCTHQWQVIQEAVGQTIFKKIGFMALGELEGNFIKENVKSMTENRATFEFLTADKIKQKFPNFRPGDESGGVFDPEGGVLYADKAVRAFQNLFVELGGHICDGAPVVKIEPGEIIRVRTTKYEFRTKSIVLCCGAWTNKMLKPLDLTLPLEVQRISVLYWPELVPGSYSTEKFIPFFEDASNEVGYHVYGLPSDEYPGHVKVCLHQGPAIDPDHRDTAPHQWTTDLTRKYVKNHFPGLGSEPSIVESCMYTWTPDEHFILDRHPKWSNIVIGAGFSGHGFKLAPAVGKVLADLVMKLPSEYDLNPFRMNRFPSNVSNSQKSKL